jgi:predicted alpha/beta-fold hydrolase
MATYASEQGWSFAVPHFRGCSGELNYAPRAYHSGDFAEIDWILKRFKLQHAGPLIVVGISMGGNALLRWAAETQSEAKKLVAAVAAVCSPLDLAASGHAIGRGFNRLVYTRMFMRTMVPKALAKLQQYPGLFDRQSLLLAKDLYDFDNVFTGPLHGFDGTEDYWQRASAKPILQDIKVPALVMNALNDPFVPANSLPESTKVSKNVTLHYTDRGGHVGYTQGLPPGNVHAMPQLVGAWLRQYLT